MPVFITRCRSTECRSVALCLRAQLPRNHCEQKYDYDKERGTARRCHAYIRYDSEKVKEFK